MRSGEDSLLRPDARGSLFGASPAIFPNLSFSTPGCDRFGDIVAVAHVLLSLLVPT